MGKKAYTFHHQYSTSTLLITTLYPSSRLAMYGMEPNIFPWFEITEIFIYGL